MPIYAYCCNACGHQKDVLQKVSDPALTDCPACGQSTLRKQVTAAGFQLKGGGWYATDFKNKSPVISSSDTKTAAADSSTKDQGPSDSPSAASSHTCGSGACKNCV